MNKKTRHALAGLLTLSFATASAAPALAYGDRTYTVIDTHVATDTNLDLPDRVLPLPNDPRRAAAERWLQKYPARLDRYRVLLQDEAGNYAQCVGMAVDLQQERNWYNSLEIDSVAFSIDSLRLMRPALGAADWPVALGSCVPVDGDDVLSGTFRDHAVGLQYGPNIERVLPFTAYGDPRPAPLATARGLSTRFQDSPCRNAGYNPAMTTLSVGDQIRLPGLCNP